MILFVDHANDNREDFWAWGDESYTKNSWQTSGLARWWSLYFRTSKKIVELQTMSTKL